MSSPVILAVDDEKSIRDTLSFALTKNGFECDLAASGSEALELFDPARHRLVVLDIMMPAPDGLDVCRRLRAHSDVPVLFLSSCDEETDRVVGLELGADDYVTKPFSPRELVARVKAILRRTQAGSAYGAHATGGSQAGRLARGRLVLDQDAFRAWWSKSEVKLTPSELRLLAALMRRPDHVLSRDQLMDALGDAVVSDRTIDSHLRNVRKKLADAGADSVLETVAGVGYRLGPCS